MGLRSAPHYWVECDGTGCGDRVPAHMWGALGVWSSSADAYTDAYAHDWEDTTDGAWLCPTCQLDPED